VVVRKRREPLVIRSVAFDRGDLALLDAVAEREERSVSSLVRLAVRRELVRREAVGERGGRS
jgi:hypothetical protein